jgi:hypothetical protein
MTAGCLPLHAPSVRPRICDRLAISANPLALALLPPMLTLPRQKRASTSRLAPHRAAGEPQHISMSRHGCELLLMLRHSRLCQTLCAPAADALQR